MKNPLSALRISVVVFGVACALAACGDDKPSSQGLPPSPTGGNPTAAPEQPIAPRPLPEKLCEPVLQRGSLVEELERPRDLLTQGLGGTIVPGTYALVQLVALKGGAVSKPPDEGTEIRVKPARTGRVGRATLYVTRDALRYVEARSASGPLPSEDTRKGFTYRVAGEKLKMLPECPSRGVQTEMRFAASPDSLWLFVDDSHAEVYQRIPY